MDPTTTPSRELDDTLALLRQLVAFDTTSRVSNLDLIDFAEAHLARHGIASLRVSDAGGTKANLYATIGPTDRGGVLLAGHTDVVPAEGPGWTTPPFTLDARHGRLYGRGSADMKGFIACVLAMVPAFASAGLHTPIHLALTFDEEIGCVGVRRLLDVLALMPVRPRMGIVGEPTSMRVVCEHKGKVALRVRVRGREAHSSRPPAGVNAVAHAARLIAFIGELAEDKRRHGPFDPLYEVPYTTLHVGVVRGGSALNVVPAECSFDFEIRHLPGEAPDALLERIGRYADDTLLPTMR